VALFTGRGTHDGQLGPMPASGAQLAFPLCEVLRYDADDNVTGGEMYYDQTGIAAQVAAATTARARQPGEGDAFWMLGGLYEVLLSSEDTGGTATVMQMTVPAGMGPPLHTHAGPEILQVIEGTVTSTLGDQTIEAGPGAVVYIPAGTPERFDPTTDAKVVVTYLPGGIEQFFAEAGEPASRREVPPAPTAPPDVERLTALGAKYGLQILPPPGG